jgi:hypothetical protein
MGHIDNTFSLQSNPNEKKQPEEILLVRALRKKAPQSSESAFVFSQVHIRTAL